MLQLCDFCGIAIIDHELEELRGMEEIGVKWQIRDEKTGKSIDLQ